MMEWRVLGLVMQRRHQAGYRRAHGRRYGLVQVTSGVEVQLRQAESVLAERLHAGR
jgi:hypothetical protein